MCEKYFCSDGFKNLMDFINDMHDYKDDVEVSKELLKKYNIPYELLMSQELSDVFGDNDVVELGILKAMVNRCESENYVMSACTGGNDGLCKARRDR